MKWKALSIALIVNAIIGVCAYKFRPGKIDFNEKVGAVKFVKPSNFPEPNYNFKSNPVTPDGFKLGKILFYDRKLSLDESISCANCHQANAAFSNVNMPLSAGIKGCVGKRNAPGIFNLAWERSFMWDGRISNVNQIPTIALTDKCEMANELFVVSSRLQNSSPYPDLFNKAFGTQTVTPSRILLALSQFMVMLVSANSKYDKVNQGQPGAFFTDEEKYGYDLFKKNCNSCHTEPLFTDHSYRNNGLDLYPKDKGRYLATGKSSDEGLFRVPTLRNVELTAPYMHDGRFSSLNEVLNHYNGGIKVNSQLDAQLFHNGKFSVHLSVKEQNQIIAFLKTLTDRDFVENPLYQFSK